MRRKLWLIAIVAVLALALVLAAGCGSKKSTTSTTPTQGAASSTSAADLVKAAQAAGAKTTGGTIAADLSITVNGDSAKLGALSAQIAQALSKPITMHIEGSVQDKPSAADMTMQLSVGGKTIPLAIKMTGGKGWIQYGGKWFVLPASALKSMNTTTTTTTSSDPVAEIKKSLGIDVTTWNPTWTMIGTENVGGVDASHVQLTADTTKAIADINQALANPQLWSQAGSAAGSATGTSKAQIQSIEGIVKPLLAMLQTKVTDFKVDMWIGNADTLMHKVSLTLAMTFGTQMSSSYGLQGIDITGTVDLSNYNAPVTVTAPSGALPYKALQKALKGLSSGLMGGAATGL
jgi:hypothetical protein